MWRHSIASGVVASLMTSLVSAADYEHYVIKKIEIIDLGTLGGDESVANDINDLGEVVGWSYDSIDKMRGFIDRGDGIEALMPVMQGEYAANGINNHTHVVGEFIGQSREPSDFEPGSAFYWEPEIFLVVLDDVEPNLKEVCKGDGGEVGANAKAINDAGVIVGYRIATCPGAYREKAARWDTYASPWQPLEASPLVFYWDEDHGANDINSSGRIVGSDNDSGKLAKFGMSKVSGAWSWMGTPFDVPHPVTTSPEWYEPHTQEAFGVNDASRVVGRATLYPQGENTPDWITRAYWWSGVIQWPAKQLPIFADTKSSAAYEINNQEFIVGYADRQTATFLPRQKRAVVWHADFGIKQLPALPGGTLVSSKDCEALAVNKRKASGLVQAVGYCQVNGKRHAVRWDILTAIVTIAP
jgi:uncharacterized membrane protein